MIVTTQDNWFSSKETTKKLKISDCDLMHLREKGKLVYKKERNAFLYSEKSIDQLKLGRLQNGQ